jgi:ABC-2 type transport system ATP-binding protein
MNSPAVEVSSLTKRYSGGTLANRNISFTVEPGEFLGILGPNGAGKTTLVRQITTELIPTEGGVRVFGIDGISRPNEVKRFMGVMPQEAGLYWGLSVYDHLRIFGKLRGLPAKAARKRAAELVVDLGLEEHRDKQADHLSGGLKRRLLLGIATVADPPLLVLDEPSAGLDPEARHHLWNLLRTAHREGATILLTTHNMLEAEELCDRVGIVQNGTLLAHDTVANLKTAHGYEYKIAFESVEGVETLYGSDDRTLVAQVQSRGIRQYSVSKTTLEDVYLGLTRDRNTSNGDDA